MHSAFEVPGAVLKGGWRDVPGDEAHGALAEDAGGLVGGWVAIDDAALGVGRALARDAGEGERD